MVRGLFGIGTAATAAIAVAVGGPLAQAGSAPAAANARPGHVVAADGAAVPSSSQAATQRLQLVLPLKANDAGLAKLTQAISSPSSSQYRHYRSIGWLSNHYGASAAQRAKVVGYLRRQGATHVRVDVTGMFVDADLSAAKAAQLFSTNIVSHGAPAAEPFTTAAKTPTIPAALQGAVTGVVGLSTKPLTLNSDASQASASAGSAPLKLLSSSVATGARVNSDASKDSATGTAYTQPTGTPSACSAAKNMQGGLESTGFAPNQYLSAYNYTKLHNSGYKGQGERVALIEIDGFKVGNINTFASCFGLYRPPIDTWGVGISKPLAAGGESTLDLEVLDAAAPRLKEIDVYESKSAPSSVLKAMTAAMQNKGHVPQVISASLGLCEPAMRQAVGTSGIRAADAAFEVAASHGISVVAASGDDGSSDCVGTNGLPKQSLAVNYPASSKWVTSVGGTQLELNTNNSIKQQFVWNDGNQLANYQQYGGGGGGSSILGGGLPWYQKGTVSGKHRQVPDLALLADVLPGYDVYCTAKDCGSAGWEPVGGTSAATPLFAAGLALIDQDLRLHHKKQLGFPNPLLYKLGRSSNRGKVFYDMPAMNNVGGNDDVSLYMPHPKNLHCCSSKTGYDNATGWGGIDLTNLAGYALK